jgi:hypothetical protein
MYAGKLWRLNVTADAQFRGHGKTLNRMIHRT